jgi:hypothetical protein
MSGFLASLAIGVAASGAAFVIIHFRSRRAPTQKAKDLEELKRQLFDQIEEGVREVRETYEKV